MIRKRPQSAVESTTAPGVVDSLIPRLSSAGTLIWSYPAPLLNYISASVHIIVLEILTGRYILEIAADEISNLRQ